MYSNSLQNDICPECNFDYEDCDCSFWFYSEDECVTCYYCEQNRPKSDMEVIELFSSDLLYACPEHVSQCVCCAKNLHISEMKQSNKFGYFICYECWKNTKRNILKSNVQEEFPVSKFFDDDEQVISNSFGISINVI